MDKRDMREMPLIKEPKLSGYFAAERKLTFGIIVYGILTNLLIIWIPSIQGQLIDLVLAGEKERNLAAGLLLFLGLVAMVQFFRFFKRYYVQV